MRHATRIGTLVSLTFALAAASATLVGGCGKGTEGPTVDTSSDRILELEKQMSDLARQREGAGLSTGVSGAELAVLQRSLREAQDRVHALEERMASLPAVPAAGGPASTAGGSSGPTGGAMVPSTIAAGPDGTYSEEQLTAFRKIQDEVQRRKDAEAAAARVKVELTRAGVTLTPEAEAAVMKLHQSYREKMQELFKNGYGSNEADRQATTDKRNALQVQFEADLRNSVPASDADKIVEAMKRGWPGFFPRQRQDSTGGGGAMGRRGAGTGGGGMGALGGG